MRVILVGDDDQNIYGFRGADAAYMQQLITGKGAVKYELTENYRSKDNIVSLANQWAATISQRLKTQPCFASQQQNGLIQITQYAHHNIITPLAAIIGKAALSGSTCVLTKTNEEAQLLCSLLLQQGLRAKLIQSNDCFSLGNLYELRYFSDSINSDADHPLITDEDWANAKRRLQAHIHSSAQKDLALATIQAFEAVHTVRKYKSDWQAFLFESKLEDFLGMDTEVIDASTIHKAKGKEFDNVYLLLQQFTPHTDEEKRQLYVAITRAKTNLGIHYQGTYLQPFTVAGLVYHQDANQYPEPQQITLHLTHRDVQLGYFEYVHHRLHSLFSGATLKPLEDGLANAHGEQLLKYAQKFRTALQAHYQRGFRVTAARINFVVYWKDEVKQKEVKILLPPYSCKKYKYSFMVWACPRYGVRR